MSEENKEEVLASADETEVEIEVDQEQQETPESQQTASDSDLDSYSGNVQKRINKLTSKLREAERREQAAIEYAGGLQQRLDTQTAKTVDLDNSFVNEFENRVTVQQEHLKNELKGAIDRGDIDLQVELSTKLAKLAAENDRLVSVKATKKAQAEAAQQQPQVQQQPQQQPTRPAPPDDKAVAWKNKNTWFGPDEPMTLTAFSIHKNLVQGEGYDPATDEYYQELDRRMRIEFPHKFNVTRGASSPSVAGATRGGAKGATVRKKLSPSQVAVAKKLGVPLERYAKELQRMQT
jgi:hypothetical protein